MRLSKLHLRIAGLIAFLVGLPLTERAFARSDISMQSLVPSVYADAMR